jgi:energy-converting hydrogenase Eha subunit A
MATAPTFIANGIAGLLNVPAITAGVTTPAIFTLANIANSLAVEDQTSDRIPDRFALQQNYPNPFNPTTSIAFSLPVTANVTLAVYSVLGSTVAELASGRMEAGYHSVVFDASQLSSGVYYYRIQAGDYAATRKLVLLR